MSEAVGKAIGKADNLLKILESFGLDDFLFNLNDRYKDEYKYESKKSYEEAIKKFLNEKMIKSNLIFKELKIEKKLFRLFLKNLSDDKLCGIRVTNTGVIPFYQK